MTQAFSSDHATTLSSWATSIASESAVSTAVVRGNIVIVITANTSGVPVILQEAQTTGTTINNTMSVRETVANQESHEKLVYGG